MIGRFRERLRKPAGSWVRYSWHSKIFVAFCRTKIKKLKGDRSLRLRAAAEVYVESYFAYSFCRGRSCSSPTACSREDATGEMESFTLLFLIAQRCAL